MSNTTPPAASGAAPALPTDAMIHAAAHAYDVSQATPLVKMRCAISAALARQEAAPAEDGYAKAFYEIASVLGIGSRADTPENVFRNEMLPKLKLMAEVFGDKYCADCRKTKGADPAVQAESTALADEFETWVKRAYRDAYEATFTVYNMEVAWHAGRSAALASPQVAPTPVNEWNEAIEAAARRIENGSFLHDQSPAKLFANQVVPVIRSMKRAAPVQVAPSPPNGFVLMPVKLSNQMIEAALEEHYGKRPVREAGGAAGICMRANGRDYSGADAMRRMWKGLLAATPMQPGAAADDARDAALWREHMDKLDALVTYCPTCCQGSCASKDMTRDEIIFECGKTVGRQEGTKR